MEKKMEKMVNNNVQLHGNRIPKAKRSQAILDLARLQHEKKRRIAVADTEETNETINAGDNTTRNSIYLAANVSPVML